MNDTRRAPSPPPQRNLAILTGTPKLGPPPARVRHAAAPTATETTTSTAGPEETKTTTDAAAKTTRKRSTRKPPTTPPDANHAATPTDAAQPSAASTPARRGRARKSPSKAAADRLITVPRAISVDEDLAADLAAYRRRTRMTNTEVILTSIKTFHSQLTQMVDEDAGVQVVHGELWDEIVPAATTHPGGTRQQIQFHPTNQQLEVIERLIAESGARDRSHLLGLTLRAYLNEKD